MLQFDWDDDNLRHLARHAIKPEEVEEVVQNRPVDLTIGVRNKEERIAQVGETNAGRILIVVTTVEGHRIRVVTSWPAKERFRRYFLTLKRNGNVGRTEEEDFRK